VALVVATLVACSGAPSASDVLSRASESLDTIRSGELHVSVLVETGRSRAGSRIGFELGGPFALGEEGELPEARITYTQIAGEDELSVTLTSTGETAYQTVAGQTTEMGEPQLDALRAAGGSTDGGGFGQLGVGEWIEDPQLQDGGRRGGVDAYLVTGRLDVVAALNGMVAAAQSFGGSGAAGIEHLDAADEELIENAIRSSSVRVYAGEEDGILRAISLLVEFQADAEEEVLDALGPLAGERLSVELGIDDPNSAVEVEAPPDASEESSP
jgi:hypothetical protein